MRALFFPRGIRFPTARVISRASSSPSITSTRMPEAALETAEQEVGVRRLPGGAGGDGPDGLHPVGLQQLAEAPEGGLGLPDVLLPDGPLQEDVAAQPDRFPQVLEDPVRESPAVSTT